MSSYELIQNTRPVWIEGGFAILIGLLIVGNSTLTDIRFHDDYVLPWIGRCHPQNQEQACQDIRNQLGLPKTAHIEIGNAYWEELIRQSIFIGVIMFVIRLGFGFMLQTLHKKIRITTILIAFVWGASATIIFMAGVLDLFYYWFQEEKDVPTTLDWLDGKGFFLITQGWTGNPDRVEAMDLYLTNVSGFIMLGFLVLIVMVVYNEQGLLHRGIA